MSLPEIKKYNAPPSPKPNGGCSITLQSLLPCNQAAQPTLEKNQASGGGGDDRKNARMQKATSMFLLFLLIACANFSHINQLPKPKKKKAKQTKKPASVLPHCVQVQSVRISTRGGGGRLAAPTHAPGAKNYEAIGPWRRERDLVFWARPVLWCAPHPPAAF